MAVRRQHIIGRVHLQPAIPRTIYRHPGVRRIRAHEVRLTRGWLRIKIAAHIARCQAQRPQTADLHMGKVLTDPTASAQDIVQWRAYRGGLGIIHEVGIDAPGEIKDRSEEWLAKRERWRRIMSQARTTRDVGRFKQ